MLRAPDVVQLAVLELHDAGVQLVEVPFVACAAVPIDVGPMCVNNCSNNNCDGNACEAHSIYLPDDPLASVDVDFNGDGACNLPRAPVTDPRPADWCTAATLDQPLVSLSAPVPSRFVGGTSTHHGSVHRALL